MLAASIAARAASGAFVRRHRAVQRLLHSCERASTRRGQQNEIQPISAADLRGASPRSRICSWLAGGLPASKPLILVLPALVATGLSRQSLGERTAQA